MSGQTRDYLARVRGCLLGGALGDALGAPLESLSMAEIGERYGPAGIAEPPEPAQFTDDTQMALFTAEGLIRAAVRRRARGVSHTPTVVWHAYLRWLSTQGTAAAQARTTLSGDVDDRRDGWLVGLSGLHARRAPGATCLSALESGRMGTLTEAINDSKGCGGVMRAAPAGLCRDKAAFAQGRDIAAITHGHPAGYDAAGALALMVERLVAGDSPHWAVRVTRQLLLGETDNALVVEALGRAAEAAASTPGDREVVAAQGEGRVAEEALAIAVYCVLSHPGPDPDEVTAALRLAANHGGDSDSTAAITGNLLGAAHGEGALPADWLGRLEMRIEIAQLADDLATEFEGGHHRPSNWQERYPAW